MSKVTAESVAFQFYLESAGVPWSLQLIKNVNYIWERLVRPPYFYG